MSNSEGYIAEMANIIGGFEDVIKCLHHEPEGSVEYRTSELAQESISQAKEVKQPLGFITLTESIESILCQNLVELRA